MHPTTPHRYYLFRMGMLDEAIRHFELACKYDKKNSFYITWLRFSYQLLGKPKKAIELFHQAVEFDPNYRYAIAALAACYRRIGDVKSIKNTSQRHRSYRLVILR